MKDEPGWLGYLLPVAALLGYLAYAYEGYSDCERRGGAYVVSATGGYVCVGATR